MHPGAEQARVAQFGVQDATGRCVALVRQVYFTFLDRTLRQVFFQVIFIMRAAGYWLDVRAQVVVLIDPAWFGSFYPKEHTRMRPFIAIYGLMGRVVAGFGREGVNFVYANVAGL